MKGQDTGYGEMPTVNVEQVDDLQSALVECERAAASDRQKHDRFIAACRDHLHIALQLVGPIDPIRIHRVINVLDEYLRRSKN